MVAVSFAEPRVWEIAPQAQFVHVRHSVGGTLTVFDDSLSVSRNAFLHDSARDRRSDSGSEPYCEFHTSLRRELTRLLIPAEFPNSLLTDFFGGPTVRGICIALVSSTTIIVSPVSAADTPPHLDTSGVNMQPAYPASALKDRERGAVVIGVNVGETGKVNYVDLRKTSGFDDLDAAAIMGTMNWRFIPATSGGKPVAGDTVVQIVFQPPDAPALPAQPSADPPKPKGDFIPASVQIGAARGEFQKQTYPALCSNGTLKSTIEFQKPLDVPASGWAAVASLLVRAGKNDAVALHLVGHHAMVTPPQETFMLTRHVGADTSQVSYSHSTILGRPQTVSLSWDSTGLVTGMLGEVEAHKGRLESPPSLLELSVSSGTATFTNSVLICRPGSSS